MKILSVLFLMLVFYTVQPLLADTENFTKAYVGFNMGLSEDLIQTDPACNKKTFYPAFGSASTWLNADKSAATNPFQIQKK